ncbi:MAG: VOC family protein, partial [Halioglobus sp.]|nr:VOC family protein [Halioglobus sp.]
MQLKWSHAVLFARDEQKMLDFYTEVLGFRVTDRGPLVEGTPDVIFMSQDPAEHHQLGLCALREGDAPPNTVHHFAFRVANFEDVRDLKHTLDPMEGIEITPLSHGNALS